jgi:hypothetical protein
MQLVDGRERLDGNQARALNSRLTGRGEIVDSLPHSLDHDIGRLRRLGVCAQSAGTEECRPEQAANPAPAVE